MHIWTEEHTEYLKSVWGTTVSDSEMAALVSAQFGIRPALSKSAVSKKGKRMNWPPRPSAKSWKPAPEPQEGEPRALTYAEKLELTRIRVKLRQVKRLACDPITRPAACAWPIGEPKRPGFHFCGAPLHNYKTPYCLEHMRIAYNKLPASMREKEAAD
jgi:GcrA cell cycle regulator